MQFTELNPNRGHVRISLDSGHRQPAAHFIYRHGHIGYYTECPQWALQSSTTCFGDQFGSEISTKFISESPSLRRYWNFKAALGIA